MARAMPTLLDQATLKSQYINLARDQSDASREPSDYSRWRRCQKRPLLVFVQAAFPIVASQQELLRNWHVEAMTYALSRVLRGEIKRLIITRSSAYP